MTIETSIVIEQRVDADVQAVWDAWTTTGGVARWWCAGWDDTTHAVDATVGGDYRFAAPGAGIAVEGTYRSLDAPRRIECSWVWSDDDGRGPVEDVVVELEPVEGATLVRVVHSGPWTEADTGPTYRQGWEHVLGRLAAVHVR